jgi:hypothetical protein
MCRPMACRDMAVLSCNSLKAKVRLPRVETIKMRRGCVKAVKCRISTSMASCRVASALLTTIKSAFASGIVGSAPTLYSTNLPNLRVCSIPREFNARRLIVAVVSGHWSCSATCFTVRGPWVIKCSRICNRRRLASTRQVRHRVGFRRITSAFFMPTPLKVWAWNASRNGARRRMQAQYPHPVSCPQNPMGRPTSGTLHRATPLKVWADMGRTFFSISGAACYADPDRQAFAKCPGEETYPCRMSKAESSIPSVVKAWPAWAIEDGCCALTFDGRRYRMDRMSQIQGNASPKS